MLTKRKAMIGYGVYTLAKPIAKAKLRMKAPEPPKRSKKLIGGIVATTAATGAAIGGLVFWRKRRGGDASTD